MKESRFIKKRQIKTTRKIVGIVKNGITGVEYGIIEIPTIAEIIVPSRGNKKTKKNKKHNSVKNTRIKAENIEKETKSATTKKTKRRYRLHATIVCSYNFKTTPKRPDLSKKNFKKKKDLFKKRQRKDKIALQNLAQKMVAIEPIFDFIAENLNSIKQNNR